MTIETSKTLGGVGALLMFIGVMPFLNFFGVIEIIGLVFVMVAIYNLARDYQEEAIFNNALYGFITGIVGVVISLSVVIITVLTSVTDFMYALFPDWNGDWTALSGLTPDRSNLSLEDIAPFLSGIFAVLIILWVSAIIAVFFARRSLGRLSVKTGVGLFSTAGLILLIGAVLIILFAVGLILIWVSTLLLAIAFFQINPQPEKPVTPPDDYK